MAPADLSLASLKGTIIDTQTGLDPKWRLVWELVNQDASTLDLGGADLTHLVGQARIGAVAIGLRAHGDGAEARFAAGAEHARGDLAAVGDQHLVEGHGRRYAVRTRASTAPRSTS